VEWYLALGFLLGLLCLCLLLSLPVAFAFMAASLAGAVVFLGGEAGMIQLARNALAASTTHTLAPVPLFLMMGSLLFHTQLAGRAIDAVDRLIARVPGRLSVVAIAGGTIFSSFSGSTIATTAILGKTLLPEMRARGYQRGIAMGPIMATGGIAMLIPPSALAVLLGSLAGISVSGLLIAGIVPGIIMSMLFVGYVVTRCTLSPELAPAYEPESLSVVEKWKPFLVDVVPLMGIFFVVVGSIVAGWASPTESAALGCVFSALLAFFKRVLSWSNLRETLLETAKVSCMILFVIAASTTFSQILAFSGATDGLLQLFEGLDLTPLATVLCMVGVLLLLGAFMDQVSMLLLTLPFFLPLTLGQDIPSLWLGVVILITMEISLLTPPFGLLLFVMRGVTQPPQPLGAIYSAAMPFVVLELLALIAIIAMPALALWLPDLVIG